MGSHYTKARLTHWLHTPDGANSSGVPESTKNPLENRVWYVYPGQTALDYEGPSENPIAIARKLDDGTSQVSRFEYNSLGNVTRQIDPALRSISAVYDANGIDLLDVIQTTGTNSEPLSTYRNSVGGASSYNAQHRPLKMIDAAGQVKAFTYNTAGQVLTSTVVRNGVNETTTFGYDSSGYLKTVTGPLSGSGMTLDYDGYGRV